MKKLLALVAGAILSVFLIATVNAGPAADSETQQKSEKSSQTTPKKKLSKKKLSKRNKAKIEVKEMKAERNALAAGAAK